MINPDVLSESQIQSPVVNQLIGLFTLTLPAFLYLYLSEKSRFHATLGKRIFGLKVSFESEQVNVSSAVFKRNLFKLLPWEIAHFSIHWMFYYIDLGQDPKPWTMVISIIAQIIIVYYLISFIRDKSGQTVYDKFSKTRVISSSQK